MAVALNTSIQLVLNALQTNSEDLVTAEAPFNFNKVITLVNGLLADAADVIWTDTRTLGTGASEDIDLTGGGLVDAFANVVAFVKAKAIIVYSRVANTTTLSIGGDANSVPFFGAAADFVNVKPGGLFVLVDPTLAGYAVAAGATDIVQVTNSAGASATYDILIVGTSA
jgi:hypothetical protein